MKIAFISQPWNLVNVPVPDGSIMIWMYEVASRLAETADVLVYGQQAAGQTQHQTHRKVHYRRVAVRRDLRWHKLARKWHRLWPGRVPSFASGWFYAFYIRRVARELRRERCDVIHIQNMSQFAPVVRRWNPTSKIVLHMHCEWLNQLDAGTMAERIKKCDLVLGCSDYIAGKAGAKFPEFAERCRAVYNGVDTVRFSQESDGETNRDSQVFELLFVGRISPEKGVHDLIEAVGLLRDQGRKVRLKLVGPQSPAPKDYIVAISDDAQVRALGQFYGEGDRSDYLHTIHQQIGELGLEEQVLLTGPVAYTELVESYRKADVLVNPSLSEAFGMSLVEALACGTVVVATRTGGMKEIVEKSGGGVLVERGDVAGLAAACAALMDDPARRARMGQAGKDNVTRFFGWDKITEELVKQYEGLCDKGDVI